MPPSPICCSSLYGPIVVPGPRARPRPAGPRVRGLGLRDVAGPRSRARSGGLDRSRRGPQESPIRSWSLQQRLDLRPQPRVAPACLVQVGRSLRPVSPYEGLAEDRLELGVESIEASGAGRSYSIVLRPGPEPARRLRWILDGGLRPGRRAGRAGRRARCGRRSNRARRCDGRPPGPRPPARPSARRTGGA